MSSTYVLVHGAWGGAHTWRTVRPLLAERGHHVFTPGLTGIGDRSHLTGPHVDLSVHVDDVINTFLYEDLSDVVLVGFSYGGMVVTGALEHVGDRIRHLVYLDAFVPHDGQSVLDLTGAALPAAGPGSPWTLAPRERDFDDPAEAAFHGPRRSPQPLRTFTERVTLRRPLEDHPFERTYVKARLDPRLTEGPDPFWDAADRVRDHPAWNHHEMESNHMIPQNLPGELAGFLASMAG
ncbi:MAG: alpha/beta fold hydrolase [Ilumatobacteraceae bacterium]